MTIRQYTDLTSDFQHLTLLRNAVLKSGTALIYLRRPWGQVWWHFFSETSLTFELCSHNRLTFYAHRRAISSFSASYFQDCVSMHHCKPCFGVHSPHLPMASFEKIFFVPRHIFKARAEFKYLIYFFFNLSKTSFAKLKQKNSPPNLYDKYEREILFHRLSLNIRPFHLQGIKIM